MDNIKNDEYFALRITEDCAFIIKHLSDISFDKFKENDLLVDSVCFRLIQIGENSSRLTDSYKAKHKDIPWHMVNGLRNRIVHDYGAVDKEIVYQTATLDISDLLQKLTIKKEAKSN